MDAGDLDRIGPSAACRMIAGAASAVPPICRPSTLPACPTSWHPLVYVRLQGCSSKRRAMGSGSRGPALFPTGRQDELRGLGVARAGQRDRACEHREFPRGLRFALLVRPAHAPGQRYDNAPNIGA